MQLAQKKRAKVSYYYMPTAPRAVPWCDGWFMMTHHRRSEESCQHLGLLFQPVLRRV